MARAVISKASPEVICFGGGLILGVLLKSLGINYNKIIYGISNYILSPSNLRYAVKKSREDTFINISGFSKIIPAACNVIRESVLGLDIWSNINLSGVANQYNQYGLIQMHPKGAQNN